MNSPLFKNENVWGNYKSYCYGKEEVKTNIPIETKLNEIFKKTKYTYKINTKITLKDKVINEKIIAKTKEYLLTIKNEKIYVKDILDIEEI